MMPQAVAHCRQRALSAGARIHPHLDRRGQRLSGADPVALRGRGRCNISARSARNFRSATSSRTADWGWARRCPTDRSTPSIPARPRRRRPGFSSAAPFKKKNVITVDMGGTSFDITLTKERRHQHQQEHRLPALSHRHADDPGRDAWRRRRLDRLDRQHGPAAGRSAECRRRPGSRLLRPGRHAADRHRRQSRPRLPQSQRTARRAGCRSICEKAREAIKPIADPLGISVERAAYGMFTIVNSNMVNGIRRVSVERGYDPRDFVLVGAGGATAAHITSLAARDRYRHRHSAEACFGALRVRPDHLRRQVQLHGDEPAAPRRCGLRNDQPAVRANRSPGREAPRRRWLRQSAIRIERSLDMRYVGQVHECTVEIGNFATTPRRSRRSRTHSTDVTRSCTPIPSRITQWKSSTSKARSTDTSTNRNRRA